MNATLERIGIEQLSTPERLELIGLIWDSITEQEAQLPIPEWHQRELDRRIAAADANPGLGIPLTEMKARLARK
jgi:putative addiction module component (TIGR02574 family)